MARSLKQRNNWLLLAVLAAHVALLYAAIKKDAIVGADWNRLAPDVEKIFSAALGLAVIGIINGQLSADWKARIVFFRWHHPLPGCQAFTRYAPADPRVDLASIKLEYGPLPVDPREQNALWYKIYKSVESDPAIAHLHQNFLFARDLTALALLMLVGLGTLGFFQIPSTTTATGYAVLIASEFVLAGQAARNYGKRFVTTVLALKGASTEGTGSV